jgi:phage tail protein X
MADENLSLNEINGGKPLKPQLRRSRAGRPQVRAKTTKRATSSAARSRSRSRSTNVGSRLYARGAGLTRAMLDAAEGAQTWAQSARDAMPRLARNIHLPSPPSFNALAEASPVILGAVGLGIGVLLGAMLPRDSLQGSMQGMGLMARSSPRRTSSRKSPSRKASTRGRKTRAKSRRK